MADEDLGAGGTDAGLSRRNLITRGAVVGGVAMWASPVVQSFTSPAGAQAGSPVPGEDPDCPDGFKLAIGHVKYEVDGGRFVSLGNGDNCLFPGGLPADFCQDASDYLVTHLNDLLPGIVVANADRSVCITLPVDCTPTLAAAVKVGNGCDTASDSGSGGRTVCFSKEPRGGGVSNVQLRVECCIPDDRGC